MLPIAASSPGRKEEENQAVHFRIFYKDIDPIYENRILVTSTPQRPLHMGSEDTQV